MEIKATETFKLPDDILESIITTGYEGGQYGIGYWFCSFSSKRNEEGLVVYLSGIDADIDEPTPERVADEHVRQYGKLWEIDCDTVKRGLKLAIKNNQKSVMKALRSACPECQLDAEDADIIIQYGLFGELVYG